ncbi:hypothetical protein BABINDRAFT_181216 [Babjeviella inositovora NRRL Y-12698]|uniref:Aminopeptidase P N-terminal domain-containing protein n=1 Tax=Babjeviella inositovora NRRL Y-12698 TaxID=984486 RepID=A0A1E3QLQ4_9ASCO|nr:uncharacterized protein BABINDRAFT_181216 [Babjeviella inositovora NRRL Y-12698]ODQ78615.1 hypothetical protein BABINDRAFT_181216 [Babjeviella inositovora NRRL Y-12698]
MMYINAPREAPPFTAGQPLYETRPHVVQAGNITPGISALEYYERRLRLMANFPARSVAVVAGNQVKYASGSVFYQFQQNTDLFYLTGWNEPDSVALLEKINEQDVVLHMLVPPKDTFAEQWEGYRTGVENVQELFNADESASIHELPAYMRHVVERNDYVYFDHVGEPRKATPASAFRGMFGNKAQGLAGADTMHRILAEMPVTKTHRALKPHIENMRAVKSDAEVAVMRAAGRISGRAYNQAYAQRFKTERVLNSFLQHRFIAGGCEKAAYIPVVAGGPNALCIHYTINNDVLRTDEMVLVDAGGALGGYCADISRTWPNAGKFSEPQAELYQAVLSVQKQCIAMCTTRENVSLNQLHAASMRLMSRELLRLAGFEDLTERSTQELYPHSIGHNLGLDLHDIPGFGGSTKLQKNQVITIEPGVYIPDDDRFPARFRGIGIRIEDDIAVGEDTYTNLTVEAAKEIVDIESIAENGVTTPYEDEVVDAFS